MAWILPGRVFRLHRIFAVSFGLLIFLLNTPPQITLAQTVPVAVVATASEYVPISTTISRAGHSYTNCVGSTSYFGQFSTYGDSGSLAASADTNTHCDTTFVPPTQTSLTTYRKVNYTIVKSEGSLYLLSCTQIWQPTASTRVFAGLRGVLAGASGDHSEEKEQETLARGPGKWSECPAFVIGSHYTFTILSAADARLETAPKVPPSKPAKLEYLGATALPVPTIGPVTDRTKVHVTSAPSGSEIYIDGKFLGNTPSDITLSVGEHVVRITSGGKEWSRSIEITAGEITVHADLTDK